MKTNEKFGTMLLVLLVGLLLAIPTFGLSLLGMAIFLILDPLGINKDKSK